jgi:transcription initiation factor TFIID subunit 2
MEKEEKEAKKHTKPHKDRSATLQRSQGDVPAHVAKRRKVDFEDDDVPKATTSAAPTPLKMHRPSVDPPTKMSAKGSKESTPTAPPPAVPKAPMLKIKKDPPATSEQTTSDAVAAKPLKGKDKESNKPTPSQTPVKPNKDNGKPAPDPNAVPINEKKCREVLKVISKLKEYPIFAQPVDPIRDGCPT